MNDETQQSWRHTSWTAAQQQQLVDLGFLSFIPSRDPLPETDALEQELVPLREYKGEMLPHLDERSPETQRFIQYWKERSEPDPRRRRLMEQGQVECFFNWIRSSPRLWDDSTWRYCMKVRYTQPRRCAIHLLPKCLRSEIETLARDAAKHGTPANQVPILLSRAIQQKRLGHADVWTLTVLAHAYFEALVTERFSPAHDLLKPLHKSVLLDIIAEKWDPSPKVRPELSDFPTKSDFLMLLRTPLDPDRERVGYALCRALLKSESMLAGHPEHRLVQTKSLVWLLNRYGRKLKLPRAMIEDIMIVYDILQREEYVIKFDGSKRLVFLLAAVMEEEQPDTYAGYLDWIRILQSKLPRHTGDAALKKIPVRQQSLLDVFRQSAHSMPLLNCVLHNEVLRGWKWLQPQATQGGQPLRTEGLLAAYVVPRLKQRMEKPANLCVAEVLKHCPKRFDFVCPVGTDGKLRNPEAFAIPVMNAVRGGTYPYTYESVRAAVRRYTDRPDLRRFDHNLAHKFKESIVWMQKRVARP